MEGKDDEKTQIFQQNLFFGLPAAPRRTARLAPATNVPGQARRKTKGKKRGSKTVYSFIRVIPLYD
jgi:hypothetical protein